MSDWAAYAPWRYDFAQVMDPRFYSLAWLDGQVSSGHARCWATAEAAIVVTLRTYPAGAVEVHGLVAAGDLDGIKTLIPLAETWGCSEGAIVASIESRAAWERALAHQGYDLHQVVLRKELDGGPQ